MKSNFRKNVSLFVVLGTGLLALFALLSLIYNAMNSDLGIAGAFQSSGLLLVAFGLGLVASSLTLLAPQTQTRAICPRRGQTVGDDKSGNSIGVTENGSSITYQYASGFQPRPPEGTEVCFDINSENKVNYLTVL